MKADYKVAKVLGSGCFANVHEVVPSGAEGTRKSKAIKIGYSEKLKSEMDIYPYLKDIPFYSRYVKGFVPNGTLREVLSGILFRKMEVSLSRACGTLPFPKALLISEQLARQLNEIHERGIAHGDVRLDNIMHHKKYGYQFIDFGNAHIKEKESEASFKYDLNQDIASLFQVIRCILANDLTNPTLFSYFKKHPGLKEQVEELIKPCPLAVFITKVEAFKAGHPVLFTEQ
ncbi:MAG: hypothetical protein K2P51_06050 [Rhabdochlamydiaceae bacterium]|nr:hypothetical protein [Rhabdochlamydiaceae bacterium]